MRKHPIQPLEKDKHGTTRFKANAIVRLLLDDGKYDMNRLAMLPFSDEDREQFAQLIGYSLSGFGDLSYVSDETYEKAADSLFVCEHEWKDIRNQVIESGEACFKCGELRSAQKAETSPE